MTVRLAPRSELGPSQRDRDLFVRYRRSGDGVAREQLVARWMPLALRLARRYERSGEPLEDLQQVAKLGLVKAIDGFDPGRDVAFSSYAVPTILGEIKRHFRDRTWAVHVPRDLQELMLRLDRAVDRLADELHRQPSVDELAAAVGADAEHVLEALQAGGAYRAVSFDAPRASGDDGVTTVGDTVGVEETGFERAEERATLDALLATVTARERAVLRMRFEDDMTQAEIGAVIGVSQMQVSRIIRQAVARLRVAAEPLRAPYPTVVRPAEPLTCRRSPRSSTSTRSAARPPARGRRAGPRGIL